MTRSAAALDPAPSRRSASPRRAATVVYAIIVGGGALLTFDSVWLSISLFLLLGWVAARSNRFDISHPATWFSLGFLLYCLPLKVLAAVQAGPPSVSTTEEDLIVDLSRLEWIALSTFLVLTVHRPSRRPAWLSSPRRAGRPHVALWTLYLVSMVVAGRQLLFVLSGGYGNKQDIALAGGGLAAFGFVVFTTALCALSLRPDVSTTSQWAVATGAAALGLMALLITGERDVLLRVGIVICLAFHLTKRTVRFRTVGALILLGLVLLPLMGEAKNLVVRPAAGAAAPTTELGLAHDILGTEFSAASRNLTRLVDSDGGGSLGGQSVWWALSGPFAPPGDSSGSSTGWFNEQNYPSNFAAGIGRGFSLVAEAYASFGVLGIVAWFAALAVGVRALHRRSADSFYWCAAYVATIPLVIYSLRADVSVITTQGARYIALPLILVWVVSSRRR